MVRVADYIAAFLEKVGIQDIFMLTGNGAMYLNDAIAQSGLNFYCARNEAAAPMMAEAYARLKGSMGAVCVTSGPGSTNAVPGLAEAWVDGAPVMILSGQVLRSPRQPNAFRTSLIDIHGSMFWSTERESKRLPRSSDDGCAVKICPDVRVSPSEAETPTSRLSPRRPGIGSRISVPPGPRF